MIKRKTYEEIVDHLLRGPGQFGQSREKGPSEEKIEALTAMVFDLLVEVEALRATALKLESGSQGANSVYGQAYRETAYRSHSSAGPSTGSEKMLGLFYPSKEPCRELLMLRRLGFSEEEIHSFQHAALDAETLT